MQPRERLRALERAAVRAWPAPASADIDGWLWRYASGGSLRANSVATLIFTGADVERAIHTAEARYRMNGVPSRFTITAVSAPADLDRRLAARGYDRGDEHATMLKVLSPGARPSAEESDEGKASLSAEADRAWLAVYLAGLMPDRVAAAPQMLARLPRKHVFVACQRAG